MSSFQLHTAKEFKHRRSHEKSRKGCIRCKKQRKKCDEARPICSRCQKRNHCCQYTVQKERFPSEVIAFSPEQGTPSSDVPDFGYLNFSEPSPSSSEAPSDSSVAWTQPDDNSRAPEQLPTSHSFNSEELGLLSHYITHTSRAIPYNADELYALHVGIPNLAFGSRPVMSSLLALSAVCQCHDLVKQTANLIERKDDIKRLLVLGDENHRASLRQLRAAIHDDNFDTVLANSALMVLYALSDHCLRVSLAKKALRIGKTLTSQILPLQSRWITSIRAASVAYVGLLNSTSGDLEDDLMSPFSAASDDITPYATALGDDLFVPEDGPSEGTRRLLLPIVSATYRAALGKLDARAQALWIDQNQATKTVHSGLEICFTSLKLLDELFTTIFASNESTTDISPSTPASSSFHLGRLDKASPWLRKYMANVTSAIPSKLWRRTIMAFLSHVPLEYLQLVQSVLDRMPVETPAVATKQTDSTPSLTTVPLDAVEQLAINIFSHWLVLVMLLDGVWWIGSIGQWELGRIITFTEAKGWVSKSTEAGETWWPESMHAVEKAIAEPIE